MEHLPVDCVDESGLDDIEDLVVTGEDAPLERLERQEIIGRAEVRERRRKRQERALQRLEEEKEKEQRRKDEKNDEGDEGEAEEAKESFGSIESRIPGVAKVYVKTWGCAHNNSDGEYMAGLLNEYGYEVVVEESAANDAHVWLLNSCTVKGPSEAHFVNSIAEAQASGKRVVVAGCVPQAWGSSKSGLDAAKRAHADQLSVIGVQQIDRVVEVVEQSLLGNSVRLMGTKTEKRKVPSSSINASGAPADNDDFDGDVKMVEKKIKLGGADLALPKIRRNPLVEIVPISTGCLNACTYCKTKHARGHLGSYPIDEIVERIEKVVSEGVLEIWLTSEDTGAYGIDIGTDITKLLNAILEVLPEPVMLRMGMTNPPYIKRHAEAMARIYEHPRIYQYLHMPIQSASNSVLSNMKREYSRQDFEEICDTLLERLPKLNIATDLIVGFPGETDEDFLQTWDLVQKYQFSVLFTNQFYPRPGTPAAKMKRVNGNIVKDRTRKISTWFKAHLPYAGREGEIHRILCTEMAPDNIHVAGRTRSYEMVLVDAPPGINPDQLMGRVVEVKICQTGKFFLMGQPTEQGLLDLDQQILPRETVLRRIARPGHIMIQNATNADANTSSSQSSRTKPSLPHQRLDYHEGDDGEDYEEVDGEEDDEFEAFDEEENESSGCGSGGCGGDSNCGSHDNSSANSEEKASTTPKKMCTCTEDRINAAKKGPPAPITHIGQSERISLKKKQVTKAAPQKPPKQGLSLGKRVLATIVALVAFLLMNPRLLCLLKPFFGLPEPWYCEEEPTNATQPTQ